MKILFLDQSGSLGGAELNLLDTAQQYRESCLVGLFADGAFRELLEQHQIPVQVLCMKPLSIRKQSGIFRSLSHLSQFIPLIYRVTQISHQYDLIYANTQKALVVGAIASLLTRRPFIYHLHDILSLDHFSRSNLQIAIALANQFATKVIANSIATRNAFIAAGGCADRVEVVYNGFQPEHYTQLASANLRSSFDLEGRFIIGHFSRLSPWKGQHILIEALSHCPEEIAAVFVGDALFGEEDYRDKLYQQVQALGLEHRVRFLGFRSDVPALMQGCDLITHTSTAPEPFGRVIVEAMLCQKPIIATSAGGAIELVTHNRTGWLTEPENAIQLSQTIQHCYTHPDTAGKIAVNARREAARHFHIQNIHQQIEQLIAQISQENIDEN